MKSRPTYCIILSWMLLFVYLSGAFRVFQPYLTYELNYDYISTVLCINKEKPQLQCNGKCHLSKELKKAAKEESEKKEVSVKLLETETIPAGGFHFSFCNSAEEAVQLKYPVYSESIHSVHPEHTTPPPRS